MPASTAIEAIGARRYRSIAHNARFEQAITITGLCHLEWGWPMAASVGRCTAARARYWGLRASLDGAASDLEVTTSRRTRTVSSSSMTSASRASTKGAKKNGIVKEMWYEPHERSRSCTPKAKSTAATMFSSELDGIDRILPDLPAVRATRYGIWTLSINTRGLPY
jgi:hypothetical protein